VFLRLLQNLLIPTVSTVVPGAGAVVAGCWEDFPWRPCADSETTWMQLPRRWRLPRLRNQPDRTGVNNLAGSTQVNAALGYSGQYVRDPATGLLAWNANNPASANSELGGFGPLPRPEDRGGYGVSEGCCDIWTFWISIQPCDKKWESSDSSGCSTVDVFSASTTELTKKEQEVAAALMGFRSRVQLFHQTRQRPGIRPRFVTASVTKKRAVPKIQV
jgi:hypothetical protein